MEREHSSDSAHSPLDIRCINTIRFLALDAILQANRVIRPSGGAGPLPAESPRPRSLQRCPAHWAPPGWIHTGRCCRSSPRPDLDCHRIRSVPCARGQGEICQRNIRARVASLPSWELFNEQDEEYRERVLPSRVTRRLAVEAGSPFGWRRCTGEGGQIVGVERFGASAPGGVLLREFGFTVENVCRRAQALMETL